MLVEMAIGDAFGAGFEFVPQADWSKHGLVNDGATYFKHPELTIGNGRYTDDTQMTLAIVEALLEDGNFTPMELGMRFFDVFHRDPRKGYGSKFYDLLVACRNGHELLERLQPNSTRSGGSMRVGPIGLYRDLETVKRLAILQASTTHNTPEGTGAAAVMAMAVHYLAHRLGPRDKLGAFLEQHHTGHAWADDWDDWASVQGVPCVHRAVTVLRKATSLTDVLKLSVAEGGDVDTVAAMAMFAASVAEDIPNDLDPGLYDGLENGAFGREWLTAMDEKLLAFARSQGAAL